MEVCMKWKLRETAEESIGRKYGRLTIVEVTHLRIRNHVAVRCICDCGGEGTFNLSQIKSGRINSCGCLKKEASRKNIKVAQELMLNSGRWSREPRIGTAVTIYRGHHYNDGDLTFDDFLLLSQENCFYCGIPPFCTRNVYAAYSSRFEFYKEDRIRDGYFTFNGLDRVDPLLPHNKDNVVPCCFPCNIAKLDFSQEEFFSQIKRRYEHLVSKGLIIPNEDRSCQMLV
jgi:hypothetical protein